MPPDTFGTPENIGLLDTDTLVYDPPTNTVLFYCLTSGNQARMCQWIARVTA